MDFDLESDQIREVFACFGLASYQAQCLEKQIAILLSSSYAPAQMTKTRYDELLDMNLDQTLGALVREIQSSSVFSSDISEKLDRAVEARNWLAHHYWWDRASEFHTPSGREKMLVELKELAIFFDELDQFFIGTAKRWALSKGITQEDFDASLAELLSAPTPPREKRRKLNKEERVINVYSYGVDEGELTLFELDDHTLWTFCDCGLTYGPERVESTRLRPISKFQKALPASIKPRPKGAKDWSYRIELSTGFFIKVSPSEKLGQFAFKWGLHPRALDDPK